MPIALLPAGNMKASNASQKNTKKISQKGIPQRELRNQNQSKLFMNQTTLIQKLNFALARTSFPVESTDNIKIKITHDRVISDERI